MKKITKKFDKYLLGPLKI
jgi:hypothetical protein